VTHLVRESATPEVWLRRWSGRCVDAETALFTMAERCRGTDETLRALRDVVGAGYAELVGQEVPVRPGGRAVFCLTFIRREEGAQARLPAPRQAAMGRAKRWCAAHGAYADVWGQWDTPKALVASLGRFGALVQREVQADASVVRLQQQVFHAPSEQLREVSSALMEARESARVRASRRLRPLFTNPRVLGM
jgi:hypothetical protein